MSSRNTYEVINSLKLDLLFTEFKQVGTWWNYKNIISPFSRLFLIPKGEGWISNSDREYHLTAGTLFLIPPFTRHSYRCDKSMDHYYVCFLESTDGALSIWELLTFNYLIEAQDTDYQLMRRLQEINPDGSCQTMIL
ncbi:MAG: AraC family ligand binding domain-containing protein [Bacteroidales bacterium]